ncbi:recombinase family protein [uncultured Ruminococcus sp.]|uniref:recombinase family protein n=1 Tax=uncultured Ruminococcus sp. TaxID=165186 RepID=UPI0025E0F8BE|nr:recombinase family protein [uncultured Ruminococcus sp.]
MLHKILSQSPRNFNKCNNNLLVRLIFQMSADGYGYGETIDRLNILGYKTKKGNQFGKNSLYDLIRNERYKGTGL